MANLVGFYGKGRKGIEYPDVEGWPDGYIPVPIHTIAWKEDNVSVFLGYTGRSENRGKMWQK